MINAEQRIRRFVDRCDRVHMCGIGGVGMAGVARLLAQSQVPVSGSELVLSAFTRMLQDVGVRVFSGHHPESIPDDVTWGIRTPAVKEGNPELTELRVRGIEVFDRAQVLAAIANQRKGIAVAGAHGKTTTSAMLTHVLRNCKVNCGYAVGGATKQEGLVSDSGTDELFVFEADESDGSLAYYRPHTAIVTNIEWDHVDHFSSESELTDLFETFIGASEMVLLNSDDPASMSRRPEHSLCAGFHERSDLLVEVIGPQRGHGQQVLVCFRGESCQFELPLPGRYNVSNAAIALLGAVSHGVSLTDATRSLESFQSVGRRFDYHEANGRSLIGDYAHHPTELKALFAAARAVHKGPVIGVFQPHRYSRTLQWRREFARELGSLDEVHLVPVYGASESTILGGTSSDLAAEMGLQQDQVHESLIHAWEVLRRRWRTGTLLLVIGAGDIEQIYTRARDCLENNDETI